MPEPKSANYLKAGRCLGLIHGVLATHQMIRSEMKDKYFCPPNEGMGMRSGQAIRIVVKHLKENPSKLHENDVFLILDALNRTFPCK